MSSHLPEEILTHFKEHQDSMLDMANDVRKLQNNFEIHLQNQTRHAEEIIKLSKSMEIMQVQITPMAKWFVNITVGKRLILWGVGLIMGVGGLVLMVAQVIKVFKEK